LSRSFAQLFVRGCRREELLRALHAAMRRIGYEPFDAARVPRSYPAERGEFAGAGLCGPDQGGTVTLLIQAWDRGFHVGLELSRELAGVTVVAVVCPPLAEVRCKAYRGGEVVLKLGADPDDELFYNPREADAAALAGLLAELGCRAPVPDPARPDDLVRALGTARADVTFDAAVAGAWPVPIEALLFASRDSRLWKES